jgi:hypothetical protein
MSSFSGPLVDQPQSHREISSSLTSRPYHSFQADGTQIVTSGCPSKS